MLNAVELTYLDGVRKTYVCLDNVVKVDVEGGFTVLYLSDGSRLKVLESVSEIAAMKPGDTI